MRRHKAQPLTFAPAQAIEVMALARRQHLVVHFDGAAGAVDIHDSTGDLMRRAPTPASAKAWLLTRAATSQGVK